MSVGEEQSLGVSDGKLRRGQRLQMVSEVRSIQCDDGLRPNFDTSTVTFGKGVSMRD